MSLVFVGERRSALAVRMKVRWEDGRLAAKQLFDALRACDIDPAGCQFFNLFERGGVARAKLEAARGARLIAMGQKVQQDLAKRGVPFVPLVHPAARGRIRLKENYEAEVRSALAAVQ